MSIVVGLAIGEHRVIAGDQRVSYSDGHKFDHSPKVRKLKTGLFGFTGTVDHEEKLIKLLRKSDDPTSLALPKGSYEALFLSRNGKCYRLADGKAAAFTKEVVFAMGAAYHYAHGAMWAVVKYAHLQPSTVKQMKLLARIGVRAAIHYNSSCGGRVQIKTMELR